MKDYFDPKDRLPLPKNFGHRPNILPFPRRPEGSRLPAAKAVPPGGGEDNPLEMLQWLVQQITLGHIRPEAVFVGTIEYDGDDVEHYPFYVCGMTRLAVKGLIHEYLEDLP
jgi:hypothetical protein